MPELRSDSSALPVLFLVGGALALLFLVAVVGIGILGHRAIRALKPAPTPGPLIVRTEAIGGPVSEELAESAPTDATNVVERAEVKTLVGKTKNDVYKLLGQADVFDFQPGRKLWIYRKRTRDPEMGTIDSSCTITVDSDRKVTRVSF